MANIPVQRKRAGLPGWLWPLLALALLALLGLLVWGLVQDRPSTAPAAPAAPAQPAQPAAGGGVVTDVPLGQPERLLALVGRPVQLSSVQVQDVVGDKTFWVGPSAAQRLFVFLEEDKTAGQKVEGKVDVNAGQTVSITGELRKLPGAEEAQQQLGLSPQAYEALKQGQVYLYARTVKVVSGG